MSVSDIEVVISGGNKSARETVASAVENGLNGAGFTSVTNLDNQGDEVVDQETLFSRALEKYPTLLSTPISISSVVDPEEEIVTEAEEDISDDLEEVETD